MFEHTQEMPHIRHAAENLATIMVKMVLNAISDKDLQDQSWYLTVYLHQRDWEQDVEPGGVTPY